MSNLFKNKYRIPTTRLQTWNYANQGVYFITICTANRKCYFGKIEEEIVVLEDPLEKDQKYSNQKLNIKLQLSEIGQFAAKEWIRTAEIRTDMNLYLGEFVIMPNHIHGIIGIGENKYNKEILELEDKNNGFGPQSKNLSAIVRGFKSSITTFAKKNNIPFKWQTRFHEHIIRDQKDYDNISNYIRNNPLWWKTDSLFSDQERD
jgi:REP element-mobilizing transposase RayT